jgi:lysophospholipase L1-like esterase
MLQGEFGCEVVNSGVAGNRTTHALERIQKDVLEHNPDLVIINFGMNDQAIDPATGTNLTPIQQYEANYRNIIKQVQDTGAEVILVAVHDVCVAKYGANTVPYYDRTDAEGVTYVDRYNEVVKKLATELDLGFLDINTKAQNILDVITSDGIHLSNIGQKKYCEWIANYCFEFVDANTDWEALPPLVLEDTEDESSTPESSAEETSEGETSADENSSKGGMKPWQLVLTICLMFAGISVFGVLFLKTVKKNKKL